MLLTLPHRATKEKAEIAVPMINMHAAHSRKTEAVQPPKESFKEIHKAKAKPQQHAKRRISFDEVRVDANRTRNHDKEQNTYQGKFKSLSNRQNDAKSFKRSKDSASKHDGNERKQSFKTRHDNRKPNHSSNTRDQSFKKRAEQGTDRAQYKRKEADESKKRNNWGSKQPNKVFNKRRPQHTAKKHAKAPVTA